MSEPTQGIAELVFYTMCRFYRDGHAFAGVKDREIKWTEWSGVDESNLQDYSIMLDPGSLRPVSMSAMRSLITELLQKGQIPLRFALEAMEFPNADEIAEAQQQQLELAALSRVKRPR